MNMMQKVSTKKEDTLHAKLILQSDNNAQMLTSDDDIVVDRSYEGVDQLHCIQNNMPNAVSDLVAMILKKVGRRGDVLDFGAGIGTIAREWRRQTGVTPDCIDIDPSLREILHKDGFEASQSLKAMGRLYDGIYSSHVIEHIEDDEEILRQIYNHTQPGGWLVIHVPSLQWLYNHIDRSLGHFRRYEYNDLVSKVEAVGYRVELCRYHDCIGVLAVLLEKIIGDDEAEKLHNSQLLKIYDRMIYPISTFFDRIGMNRVIGKNLFLLARRPED